MHWFHLPKSVHNEDVIREYERRESRKLGRWFVGLAIGVPLILLIVWVVRR